MYIYFKIKRTSPSGRVTISASRDGGPGFDGYEADLEHSYSEMVKREKQIWGNNVSVWRISEKEWLLHEKEYPNGLQELGFGKFIN